MIFKSLTEWNDHLMRQQTISAFTISRGPQSLSDRHYNESKEQYQSRKMSVHAHNAKVERWKRTPRGIRWMRRCADIAEKRREFALTDVALALAYKYNKLSREAGDYPEWSGDEAYDCIRLLLKHNIISVSEGE